MSAALFTTDPFGLASRHPLLIDESAVAALKPVVGAGNHLVLDGTNYQPVLHFTVRTMPGNRRVIAILPAAGPDTRPLYFLPYEPDAATSMVLGRDADYFFTSSLSGCTFRAMGPVATPTVTHANARTDYANTFNARLASLARHHPTWTADQVVVEADRRANTAVANTIDAMIPPVPLGTASGTLKKKRYLRKVQQHFANAQQDFERDFQASMNIQSTRLERSQGKPTLGAAVFGLRNFNGVGWSFHYQASVGIEFDKQARPGAFLQDEVALGAARQIYP